MKKQELRRQKSYFKPFWCIFLVVAMLLVIQISVVSAIEFDNIKEVPQDFNYREDVVTIRNSFLWIFPLGKVADVQLVEHTDQCLINCETKFKVNLYVDYNNPLTREYFKDRGNKDVDVNGGWYYYGNYSYEVEVPDYKEVCELNPESTNGSQICFSERIGSHNEIRYDSKWLKYDGGTFEQGEYEFEYRGQKPINKDVDFKLVLFGVDLGKEFAWWEGGWIKKRQISNLTGEIIFMNISYQTGIQPDFDDVRFVDTTTESIEYGYLLEKKVDSAWATFRIRTHSASAIYMYYNNSGVSTTSNISNVYGSDLKEAFFMDERTGANVPDYAGFDGNGTRVNMEDADWQSGFIDYGLDFDGSDEYVSTSAYAQSNTQQTYVISFNTSDTTDAVNLIGQMENGGGGYWWFISFEAAGELKLGYGYGPAAVKNYISTNQWNDGNNHTLIMTVDNVADEIRGYIDNTLEFTGNDYDAQATNYDIYPLFINAMNNMGIAQRFTDGLSDEVLVYDKVINATERGYIFNVTQPAYVLGDEEKIVPIVTLNAPEDNANLTTLTTTFNCSAYSLSFDLVNVSLYGNWTGSWLLNETNSSGINDTDYIFTKIVKEENCIWNCYACDAENTCSFAVANRTFSNYKVFVNSYVYNNESYEMATEAFSINVSSDGSQIILGYLIYNGSSYSSTKTGDNYVMEFNRIIDLPAVVGNISFYWSFDYGGERVNSSLFYQNVSEVEMGICDGALTIQTLNFTAWEEENLTRLKPYNFYGTFTYWTGDGSVTKNFSISNSSINETIICLNLNETFYADAIIQYEKDDYVRRNHYLINETFTNSSQEKELILLLTTSSTSFIIDVIDYAQFSIADAYIYIQRYYAGTDEHKTVEMALTDDSGSTIGHFEAETEDYRIIIEKDGIIIYQSGSQKIFCRETPCTLTFQTEAGAGVTWDDFGVIENFDWTLEFDETTNIWTFIYTDTSGSIGYGRLFVYYQSPDEGEITICNTSSTLLADTLTCDATGYNGTIYAKAYLSRSPEFLVYLKSVIIGGLKEILGLEGLFLSMFVLMFLGLIGLWNPTVGIVSVVGGMIILNFMGLASFGTVTIWGVIFIAIIVLWELKS